ncbi:hypothetical protein IEU95_08770 [Hoyosella rhizosphaerae]|uniref:Uncharacterized protein n=1 Tax=Hoyosella rhizosphaerae TaxID=1755582 RepID=A0A916U0A9_9ACTN|nr:hypothetical protein [Hoyosella rhizosphaerae]GGC55458.1 hypothetical protein GCM10011410_04810 [Hoyosella rhizosphaerae]
MLIVDDVFSHAIFYTCDSGLVCAVRAAEHLPTAFVAMSNDSTMAMMALGRHALNCAFEAIEGRRSITLCD